VEYLIHKIELGEDERALSQVILAEDDDSQKNSW
jgi:hypothetical protein